MKKTMLTSHNDPPKWGVKVYSEQRTILGTTWSEDLHVVSSKEEATRMAKAWQSPPDCEEFTATTVVRLTPRPLLKGVTYVHREF